MRFFYLLITLLLPGVILAQSNYNPGYVVNTNGDTLKGYINYREWYKTPKSIEFKTNLNDESPVIFNASNSNGFQINGFEKYVTYSGLLSMNKIDVAALTYHADTVRKPGRVFLKELVTGKYITLYFQSDDTKIRYFYKRCEYKRTG